MANSSTHSGTAATGGTTYGRTITQLETIVAAKVDMNTADSDDLARIDEAISAAGQAACAWDGRLWWWLRGENTFDTVADTASYNLHTVNSNAMASLWAVERMYMDDDWLLTPMPWNQREDLARLSATTGKPHRYVLDGWPPTLTLWETPDDVYTIYVKYTKRHTNIVNGTSADTDLLVPDIFHQAVYVDGAVWLLRNGVDDPLGLRNSPAFVDAMQRLAASDPKGYDSRSTENNHAGVGQAGTWPHNTKVFTDGEYTSIVGTPRI